MVRVFKAQERGPEHPVLTVADIEAEDLALPAPLDPAGKPLRPRRTRASPKVPDPEDAAPCTTTRLTSALVIQIIPHDLAGRITTHCGCHGECPDLPRRVLAGSALRADGALYAGLMDPSCQQDPHLRPRPALRAAQPPASPRSRARALPAERLRSRTSVRLAPPAAWIRRTAFASSPESVEQATLAGTIVVSARSREVRSSLGSQKSR